MASTDSASNNKNQNLNNENIKNPEYKPKKIDSTLIYCKSNVNQNIFNSGFSEKNNNNFNERFNSNHSIRSHPEYNFMNPFFIPSLKNFGAPLLSFAFSKNMNSNLKDEQKFPLNYPTNFMLDNILKENNEFYKEKKEENNIKDSNSNNNNNDENNNNSEKLNNQEKNNNTNVTKFFTNHNYGYKCSCSKTQCNRKYCECFNSGNYCVDCNCKNCNNKPPVNSYTNKHPKKDDPNKLKKEKIICTCTKSGCNKNYCECFKVGQKCSPLCRCIGCENNDLILRKRYNTNYQCNLANSIYIVKNKITVENVKEKKNIDSYGEEAAPIGKYDFIGINKKRKREENNNEENNGNNNKHKKIENIKDEINLFNDSLFDQNGKVILRHINLFQI